MKLIFNEYKDFEYCKSINCRKTKCKECDAYKYHDHLIQNDFKIIKNNLNISPEYQYDHLLRLDSNYVLKGNTCWGIKQGIDIGPMPYYITEIISVIELPNQLIVFAKVEEKEVSFVCMLNTMIWTVYEDTTNKKDNFIKKIKKFLTS
jgi:hypothetical protein